jgi:hypothetical protein
MACKPIYLFIYLFLKIKFNKIKKPLFGLILCCSQTDDHPQENLAKFGYNQ